MDCERILDVEELVLGRAPSTELRRHLAGCDACQEAEAMFREEIDLFVARRTPPRRSVPVPSRRWAALAVAAGLAVVGSALRSEDRAPSDALACMMPAEGGALACMPSTASQGRLFTRAPVTSYETVSSRDDR